MKLDKAIETLTPLTDGETTPLTYSETEATKLGIEALKRIHDRRQSKLPGYVLPLPGETKD